MPRSPYCPDCGDRMRRVMRGNLTSLGAVLQLIGGIWCFSILARALTAGGGVLLVLGLAMGVLGVVLFCGAVRSGASQKVWMCRNCFCRRPLDILHRQARAQQTGKRAA